MKKFTLALPNGSLEQNTLALLKKIGLDIKPNGRKFETIITGNNIIDKVITMRPQDIPEAIVDGMADLGFCGVDCVAESGMENKIIQITTLNYSKKTNLPVRIVIFGKSENFIDEENTLVSTEFIRLAKMHFKKAKIRFSHGSTEQKVRYGKYDFGIGVTETGQSLIDNGLKIIKTILVSPTVLISREDRPEFQFFGKLLSGALEAEKFLLIEMNTTGEAKEKILKFLPAQKSPTINQRADGLYAIKTVILKSELFNLTLRLLEAGAENIVTQNVDIVLS